MTNYMYGDNANPATGLMKLKRYLVLPAHTAFKQASLE